MTSQRAYWFAKLLEKSPSIFDTPPDLYKASGAIETNSSGSTHYYMTSGFNANYGSPASRHGRYMTISDLRMFYYLGTEVAKYKLYGWHATRTYDRDVNYNIDDIYNGEGYPICRHRSGYKMVKYGYRGSYPTLPFEYKQNQAWKPLVPSSKWNIFHKSDYLTDDSNHTYYEIDTIDIPLPFIKTWYENEYLTRDLNQRTWTYKYILPFNITTNCMVSWPQEIVRLQEYYPNYTDTPLIRTNCLKYVIQGTFGRYVKKNEAAYETTPHPSSLTVNISPYPDIYENPDHAHNVIPVGYYGEKLTSSNWYNDYLGTKHAWVNTLIPLTKGTWYLYLEFENPEFYGIANHYYATRDFVFPLYRFTPTPLWPTM